jgi:hypothetical protein
MCGWAYTGIVFRWGDNMRTSLKMADGTGAGSSANYIYSWVSEQAEMMWIQKSPTSIKRQGFLFI